VRLGAGRDGVVALCVCRGGVVTCGWLRCAFLGWLTLRVFFPFCFFSSQRLALAAQRDVHSRRDALKVSIDKRSWCVGLTKEWNAIDMNEGRTGQTERHNAAGGQVRRKEEKVLPFLTSRSSHVHLSLPVKGVIR